MNTFDLSFATAIGGYPAGAFVLADDLKTVYRCTANGNSSNPNSVSTGWAKVASDIADILALGTAAYKNVGTGSGQIPDMSSFTSSSQSAVFSAKNITGNYRVMEGIGDINFTNGAAVFTMPLAFPSSSFTIIFTDIGAGLATYAASPVNGSTVNLWGNRAGVALNGRYGYKYIAVGVI
jgi:hypothetical protein